MIDCSKKRKHQLACFNYTVGRKKAFTDLEHEGYQLILTLHSMFFVQCSFFQRLLLRLCYLKGIYIFRERKAISCYLVQYEKIALVF